MHTDQVGIPAGIEPSVGFDYQLGGVTPVGRAHSTGWRAIPGTLVALVDYESEVEFADTGARHRILPGQAVCLALSRRHRITSRSDTSGISRWSHVAYPILGGLDLLTLLEFPLVLPGPACQEAGRINTALAGLAGRRDWASFCQRRVQGFALLSLLLAQARWKPAAGWMLGSLSRLAPALSRIEQHLDCPVRQDELARAVGLSPSRFRVVFRRLTGRSPTAYRLELGLRRSQQLLRDSDLPVADIALRCGWGDPGHFSRFFHRRCGCSPRVFRQRGQVC